ncbi:MAG: hypothetical protein WDA65_06065 [Christensenellales bacterium]
MKKRNIIIIVCTIILITAGTALAFDLSEKKYEPKIESYSEEFVAEYISNNKTSEQKEYDETAVPCYAENELLFNNQGCFNLGIDAGINIALGFRTDFLERTVKMYPNPLVRENDDYFYLVYDTENENRLFLFYSKEKSNGLFLDAYPIIMKEKLTYGDFMAIKVGDGIEKVGSVDQIIPLYIEAFNLMPDAYYEKNKKDGACFSSLHLLSDGILKIDYSRKGEDYIIDDITYGADFVLEAKNGKTCYKIFAADYLKI